MKATAGRDWALPGAQVGKSRSVGEPPVGRPFSGNKLAINGRQMSFNAHSLWLLCLVAAFCSWAAGVFAPFV